MKNSAKHRKHSFDYAQDGMVSAGEPLLFGENYVELRICDIDYCEIDAPPR